MKDIMEANSVEEVYSVAKAKCHEYVQAAKKEPKNKMYRDLREYYRALRNGKKLIDIKKVIVAGGRFGADAGTVSKGWPKLAIAPHWFTQVNCLFNRDGSLTYCYDQWNDKNRSYSVYAPTAFPGVVQSWTVKNKTVVPVIPPKHIPVGGLKEDHYILWEVGRWEAVPADPYLLKRISKSVFSIEAQWDLSPVEQMAMEQYLH